MNVASECPPGDSSIAAFPSIGYLSREALALATRLWQSLSLVENYGGMNQLILALPDYGYAYGICS
jgi:hypothetical protein